MGLRLNTNGAGRYPMPGAQPQMMIGPDGQVVMQPFMMMGMDGQATMSGCIQAWYMDSLSRAWYRRLVAVKWEAMQGGGRSGSSFMVAVAVVEEVGVAEERRGCTEIAPVATSVKEKAMRSEVVSNL